MKFLYGLVLFSLSLPVSAQTWFSTEDFAGSWRIEHLDADSQTSTLTELYFDESGSFYSQSLVSSESTTRYYDSGGNWTYEDGRIRLDFTEWSDSDVETQYLQFENFSATYLSFRKIGADGEQHEAIFEAHRFKTSSFDHGC